MAQKHRRNDKKRSNVLQVYVVLLIVSVLALRNVCYGDDPKAVDGFLKEVTSARSRIKTGHYTCTGEFPNMLSNSPCVQEVWFDGEFQLVRFTTTNNESIATTTTVLMSPDNYYVNVGNSAVKKVNRKEALRYAQYFDFRALGIALAAEMDRGYTVGEILQSEAMARLPSKLEMDESGNKTITRGPIMEVVFLKYEFNSDDLPIRAETRSRTIVDQFSETEWLKMGEHYVPTQFQLMLHDKLRWQLKLDWRSVNEPFAEGFFEFATVFPGEIHFYSEGLDGGLHKSRVPIQSRGWPWILLLLVVSFFVLIFVWLSKGKARKAA